MLRGFLFLFITSYFGVGVMDVCIINKNMTSISREAFVKQINENTIEIFKESYKSFDVFENSEGYINIERIFYAYYQQIPNIKKIFDVNCPRMIEAIYHYKTDKVLKIHYKQHYSKKNDKMMYKHLIYFMKCGCVVDVESDEISVAFSPENETVAQLWIDWLKLYTKRKKPITNEICLITQSTKGLDITELKIKKPKLNLTKNYNDDIIEMHRAIIKKLKEKNANGLFLFHGLPGTGKSTYIRFLIHHLNKNVIFMSPKLAGNLDTPALMTFLIQNSNSIVVIEDAEELITAREGGRNSSISTLLNLTDGLLGECLNIQVIATFNTQVANIDKALLRKGRLQTLYEFKELSILKSNSLLQEIGETNYYTNRGMTLAEIYNMKETEFAFTKKAVIGFRTAQL
ncbi:MAG: AAA family ATPase [Chitinophagaceae bacterium]